MNIEELPAEILDYILRYLRKWHITTLLINRRFYNLTIKMMSLSNIKIRKRTVSFDKIGRECIEKYPNVVNWALSCGYIYNYRRYYLYTLNTHHGELALRLLQEVDFIDEPLIHIIIENGTMAELMLAFERYSGNKSSLCKTAIENGRLTQLKYLVQKNCPIDKQLCRYMMRKRKFKMVKWWIYEGLPCYKKTHDAAKELGVINLDAEWIKRRRSKY